MPVTTAGKKSAANDQVRLDADRSSTEHDEARSDSDQRAIKRDQTASDGDRSTHAATDAKFMEAFAAIQAERERTTANREAAATEREAAAEDRAIAAADRAAAAQDRKHAAADRERAHAEVEQARVDLEQAQLDELTGFYRLGLGTAILQREIDRARRSDGYMTLAYCDVDGLKRVNDEQGHAAGNALLVGLAEAMRARLRPYDPVVRVGGDEFVCALSDVDVEQARRIFFDIQAVLAGEIDGATVSFGLAGLLPDDSLATLLERSDLALREARSKPPLAHVPR